jgi:hypothetical protein
MGLPPDEATGSGAVASPFILQLALRAAALWAGLSTRVNVKEQG